MLCNRTAEKLTHSCHRLLTINDIVMHSPQARSAASIILRGANDFMVDEMERSIHDALCVVKRVLESKTVVPGGGAVEAALSIYLENFATSMVSRFLVIDFLFMKDNC
jgi:chaperonin GroEL (HSP60 family)